MRTKCIDPSTRKMLHAYEIGILDDEERERFEIHLLECADCFEKASGFIPTIRRLRYDDETIGVIEEIVAEGSIRPEPPRSLRSRFLDFLWPESPRLILLKPLALTLILLILAYPVYRFGFGPEREPVAGQTLRLYPMRGAGDEVIRLDAGGEVEIRFVLEGAVPSRPYEIRITSGSGEVVYSDPGFTAFSEEGLGSVAVPTDLFVAGQYTLTILEPVGDETSIVQTYHFRADRESSPDR